VSLPIKEYAAEQNRAIRELLWIERIIRRQGVPIQKARSINGQGRCAMSLHQTYVKSKEESGRPVLVCGMGDQLLWETKTINPKHDDWIKNAVNRLEIQLHKDPSLDCAGIGMVVFSLAVEWRPDMQFYVRGYLVDGRTYWELFMFRHPQLPKRLTRRESRINKPFRLRDQESRWIKRSEAEEAIAHFTNCFLSGYRPFNG
jgi:hypothetical protein